MTTNTQNMRDELDGLYELVAQNKRRASAALQRLRLALDELDAGNLEAGRNFAQDARGEVYRIFASLGGLGHLDSAATDYLAGEGD